jgi:hypothetical protein
VGVCAVIKDVTPEQVLLIAEDLGISKKDAVIEAKKFNLLDAISDLDMDEAMREVFTEMAELIFDL